MAGADFKPGRDWLAMAFVALLINSAYLTAAPSATLFYYGNVALHVALGAVVAIAAGFRLVARRWRLPGAALTGAALAEAGAAAGVVLAIVGATRQHQSILVAHIVLSVAGSALALVAVVIAARYRTAAPRARILAAAGAIVLAGAVVAVPFVLRVAGERRSQARYRIVNPTTPPLSMDHEGVGPSGPFFPSSANTNLGRTIPANFFMTSAVCGRCHKDIYEQWSASAHHFSSFNNQWYRKSIEYMQDVVGTRPSKWCAGCHDHAVFFNGRFDRPIKEQIDTPEAQAGLACTSCHSIVHVGSSMGQGDFTVEYPPLHDLAVSDNPVLQKTHDALLYLAPGPHRETFIKPFHREQTAEFCSSCHKVHLDVPVNGYRWFRGFNDYDNWQASGVSGQGARSFYYPRDAAEVRRLPHAARLVDRPGGEGRQGAVASLPGREYRAAVRQPRSGAAEDRAGLPAGRADLGRRVRHFADGRDDPATGTGRDAARRRAAPLEHVRGGGGVGAVRLRRRPR